MTCSLPFVQVGADVFEFSRYLESFSTFINGESMTQSPKSSKRLQSGAYLGLGGPLGLPLLLVDDLWSQRWGLPGPKTKFHFEFRDESKIRHASLTVVGELPFMPLSLQNIDLIRCHVTHKVRPVL